MYYYYLMDMFGRIPIVTDCNTPIKELQQSSRSAAFRFIVSELQTVAPLLAGARSNVEGPYYGRITRPVVHFLLAKLALNATIYTDDDWTDNSLPDGRNILFTSTDTSSTPGKPSLPIAIRLLRQAIGLKLITEKTLLW